MICVVVGKAFKFEQKAAARGKPLQDPGHPQIAVIALARVAMQAKRWAWIWVRHQARRQDKLKCIVAIKIAAGGHALIMPFDPHGAIVALERVALGPPLQEIAAFRQIFPARHEWDWLKYWIDWNDRPVACPVTCGIVDNVAFNFDGIG